MSDRTIHAKVKSRTGELIKLWANDFRHDPSLGIMAETYKSLKSQGISVDPPSRPQKREITEADRRQEEEELQMALAMSLTETKISSSQQAPSRTNQRNEIDNGPNAYTLPKSTNDAYSLPTLSNQQSQTQYQPTPIAERTAATVSRVRGLYEFVASEAGELSFHRGDIITVIESAYKDWWRGSLHGVVGIFPTNYVENLPDPTPADLQREAEEEMKVFAGAKNVEKLLSILSSAEPNDPSIAENDQLQNLYHSTISIRPKLVRLIEKYSQKKDDLILLNEKFSKARKDYDELMEASLSRYQPQRQYPPTGYPPQPQGQRVPSGYNDPYQYQQPQRTGPPADQVQQQRPMHSGPHQGYASAPVQRRQNTNGYAPSDPYPVPMSPSGPQYTADPRPSAPPLEQRSSYDHERAEREGGPPIAYYKEEAEDDTVVPRYEAPVIPNPKDDYYRSHGE